MHTLVPWLLIALVDLKVGRAAPAGRLSAAALQLLSPLLDGLHARRLGLLNRRQGADAKRLLLDQFIDTLVGNSTVFVPASASTSCLFCDIGCYP